MSERAVLVWEDGRRRDVRFTGGDRIFVPNREGQFDDVFDLEPSTAKHKGTVWEYHWSHRKPWPVTE